ncbi:MAG: formate--tetrahydrofolate ligase, partial [Myxococcota bacterium]
MYGVEQAVLAPQARKDLETLAAVGWEKLPLCVAKTPHALHDGEGGLVVRSLRVWAGAGFLQALAGDIVTLPGLPRSPAAHHIDLTDGGDIVGLH